ncbi:YihY/virulence factor BrkB family protein [Haloechinothrix salitolerans]|uniref:YihY/virulence factor BrkB family protein n=1 Tax=Haloechinothrix salitolerans TaxID=926830 RepID=A0ABW2C3T3_9PSEU
MIGAWRDRVVERLPRRLRVAGRLPVRTVTSSLADRVPGLAAEVAFFSLLSLPALLLMLLGSLGFLAAALGPAGETELHRLVFDVPRTFLTPGTYEWYSGVATDVLREGRAGVMSFGVLLSLWSGSRAAARLIETVAIAYNLEDPRPLWRRRLLALGLTLGGLIVGIAILPIMVIGPRIIGLIIPGSVEQAASGVINVLFWPGMGLVVLLLLVSFYHVAAPWQTPWHRDLPGAVLTVVIWMLAAAGLRFYVTVSLRGDEVFAQLAAPLAVVLWLYVTAFAVLIGAEFNAEIEKMWPHRDFPWQLRRST